MVKTRLGFSGLIMASMILGLAGAVIGQQPSVVDPVCGMTISKDQAIIAHYGNQTYYFCSDHCIDLFVANPAQYIQSTNSPTQISQNPTPQPGVGDRESKSSGTPAGCGGCPAASSCLGQAKSQSGCGAGCGQTSVPEINSFHSILQSMYLAGQNGDTQTIRNSIGSLMEMSNSLNRCNAPEGAKAKEFHKARKALQKSVNNLSKSCKKGSDDRILSDCNTVHERYVVLQALVQ